MSESNVTILTDEDLLSNALNLKFDDSYYAEQSATRTANRLDPAERTLNYWFNCHPAARRVWIERGLVPVEVMNSKNRPTGGDRSKKEKCPFCGADGELLNNLVVYVECLRCDARGPIGVSGAGITSADQEADSERRWNDRLGGGK